MPCQKIEFETYRQALAAASVIAEVNFLCLRPRYVYLCEWCRKYQLTSKPREKIYDKIAEKKKHSAYIKTEAAYWQQKIIYKPKGKARRFRI